MLKALTCCSIAGSLKRYENYFLPVLADVEAENSGKILISKIEFRAGAPLRLLHPGHQR